MLNKYISAGDSGSDEICGGGGRSFNVDTVNSRSEAIVIIENTFLLIWLEILE